LERKLVERENALMALIDLMRQLLGRKGYLLSRFEAGVPERIDSYLAKLVRGNNGFGRMWAFDGDPETLNALAKAFGPTAVSFHSDPRPESLPTLIEGQEDVFIETDIAAISGGLESPPFSWLGRASIVIVRSKINRFWSGQNDLLDLTRLMVKHGLDLRDVLQQPSGPPTAAPGWNVFVVYERGTEERDSSPKARRLRRFRVSEALTLLSAPVASEATLTRLTGRGTDGYGAGIFNPGAFQHGAELLVLGRAEGSSWPVHRRSQKAYLLSCQPMLLSLRRELSIGAAQAVRWKEGSGFAGFRFEDFRVFRHQERFYSNHSYIQSEAQAEGAVVRPERLRTSVGISSLEIESAQLTPLGEIELDRPRGLIEKNWAMFSSGERVHLIYSFSPYRLFAADRFPDLHFSLLAEARPNLPFPEDGLFFRNSINPVPWDSGHLLHIVHKVFPEKRYVFWAVLLDTRTLLPVKIIPRPLASDRSSGASITYVCSAICQGEELLLFGGLDDCSTGGWKIAKAELNRQWVAIA
jgi:predicted GH43/DUF377 family glycosyl hydrolase